MTIDKSTGMLYKWWYGWFKTINLEQLLQPNCSCSQSLILRYYYGADNADYKRENFYTALLSLHLYTFQLSDGWWKYN